MPADATTPEVKAAVGTAGPGRHRPPRHLTLLNPRVSRGWAGRERREKRRSHTLQGRGRVPARSFLSLMASYDVASNIYQALGHGDVRAGAGVDDLEDQEHRGRQGGGMSSSRSCCLLASELAITFPPKNVSRALRFPHRPRPVDSLTLSSHTGKLS